MSLIRRFGSHAAPAPAPAAVPAADQPGDSAVDAIVAAVTRRQRSAKASTAAGRPEREHVDRYQDMTDQIVQAMEKGVVPWKPDWDGAVLWPRNGITDRPHHGVNVPMLLTRGYQDDRWATFQQAKKNGWHVKHGEKGTPIYFFKAIEKKIDEDAESGEPVVKKIPILVRFTVFNFSQIEGVPEKVYPPATTTVAPEVAERIEDIVAAMGAEVVHGFRTPCFEMKADGTDRICLPERASFESDAAYYATKIHELVHWTGHPDRMNRAFARDPDSPDYCREELRAEIGSAMLCARLGIPYAVEGHAGYIDAYVDLLKGDKREIYRASRDAERIATHILAHHPDFRDEIRSEAKAMAVDARAAGLEEHFDAAAFDYNDDEVALDMEDVMASYSP